MKRVTENKLPEIVAHIPSLEYVALLFAAKKYISTIKEAIGAKRKFRFARQLWGKLERFSETKMEELRTHGLAPQKEGTLYVNPDRFEWISNNQHKLMQAFETAGLPHDFIVKQVIVGRKYTVDEVKDEIERIRHFDINRLITETINWKIGGKK